jgi:hypothetical protein
MNRHGKYWLGHSLGLLLLACPLTLFSQSTDCTAQELKAALPSGTPVYRAAFVLSETLSKNGILVKCILGSTMEGTFERQSGAAVYRTVHGSFEVLFLPDTLTFDRLNIVERHNGDRYLYRFQGPPQAWPANLIDSAFRIYFVKDKNLLFVVDENAELAAILQDFVRSQH